MSIEEQKIEKLLKPRYKVIADYPHSPYEVGELIEFSDSGTGFHCTTTRTWSSMEEDMVDSQNYFHIDKLTKYPHLFKSMQWWEERTKEEMPKVIYKKVNFGNGKVFYKTSEVLFLDDAYMKWKFGGGYSRKDFLPATLTEYEQFISNTKA